MNLREAIDVATEAIRHRPAGCAEPERDEAAVTALRDALRYLDFTPGAEQTTPRPLPAAASDQQSTVKVELFCPECGDCALGIEPFFSNQDWRNIRLPFPEMVGWHLRPCEHTVLGGTYTLWVSPTWMMFVPHSWNWPPA